MSVRNWQRGFATSVALLVALVVIGLLASDDAKGTASASPNTTTTVVLDVPSSACPGTWEVVESDNGNHRWFQDGIQSIREASDPASARSAAYEWLDKVKRDPQLLVGAASVFLGRQVDVNTLASNGCITPAGAALASELEAYFAASKFAPSNAPTNGTNTGVNGNGNVTVAGRPGITGDRKSVEVIGPDGKSAHIMARCGNPVVKGKPKLPEGPTDQPEQPEKPKGGKDHTRSPVQSDPNHPDERVRPVVCPWNHQIPENDPNCKEPPAAPRPTTTTIPDQGSPGTGTDGNGDAIDGGGNQGVSDPEPEPNPPPADSPPVTGDPCKTQTPKPSYC